MSSYRTFMSHEMKKVRRMHPGAHQTDVMRMAAANWHKGKKRMVGSKTMRKVRKPRMSKVRKAPVRRKRMVY